MSSHFPRGIPLDFMFFVFQIQRIVSHFQWKRLTLLGHSFGAHLLEFYAATYTDKVSKFFYSFYSPFHIYIYLFISADGN